MLILKIFLFYIKLTFLPDERKISNEERKKKSSEGDIRFNYFYFLKRFVQEQKGMWPTNYC